VRGQAYRPAPEPRTAGPRRNGRAPRAAAALAAAGLGLGLGLAACGDRESDYFPLRPGWTWEYRVATDIQSVGKQVSKTLVNDRPRTELDGKRVVPRIAQDGRVYYYAALAEGVALVATREDRLISPAPPGEYVLKYPLEKGATWQVASRTHLLRRQVFTRGVRNVIIDTPIDLTYTVEALDDTVTVPAGTFRRCLRLHAEGTRKVDLGGGIGQVVLTVTSDEWFAPGVGLVKLVRSEDSAPASPVNGTMVRELTRLDKPGWFD
jgi:hypothetical protein